VLEELELEGTKLVASQRMAELGGVTSAQVRKDLSYFGAFGRRGLGYRVPMLRREIRAILGLNRRWRVALLGAGNVGSALYSYKEFHRQGFDIVAVFDVSPTRVGRRWNDVTIRHVDRLPFEVARLGVELGVIAVPVRAAQGAADRLVAAGVRGILNFAHRKLNVPPAVIVRHVSLSRELESLAFAVKTDSGRPSRRASSGRGPRPGAARRSRAPGARASRAAGSRAAAPRARTG